MKMSEMFPSNYLKKEDVATPVVATIRQVIQDEIQGDGGKELKAVVHFMGDRLKPMILNRGNAECLCMLYGDDSSFWHGRQIEVYSDPSVMFAGKRVGGIRLRAPGGMSNGPAPIQMPTPSVELWDLSDGKTVMQSQTREQVEKIINDSGMNADQFKAKPHGAARELAKPADQYGFGAPAIGSQEDSIPF